MAKSLKGQKRSNLVKKMINPAENTLALVRVLVFVAFLRQVRRKPLKCLFLSVKANVTESIRLPKVP